MEAVRVKAVGEDGYISPVVVDSARRRARERERQRRERQQEPGKVLRESDETKSRERAGQDARDRASLPGEDDSGKLREAALECLEIVDDFNPAYEFEVVKGC
jgi:hypothetical protein